jgi:hypothetical protein
MYEAELRRTKLCEDQRCWDERFQEKRCMNRTMCVCTR